MALLDVTILLYDPDFVDTITYIQRIESIDGNGRGVYTETQLSLVGSIQPATDIIYQQMPDMARLRGDMELFTTSRLISQTTTNSADLVYWQGNYYTVRGVLSFTNYGEGHIVALLGLRDMVLSDRPG